MRTADDFLQAEAGGPHHQAVVLICVQAEAEAAYEEFRHYDNAPEEWLAALKLIATTDPKWFPDA